MEIGRTFDGAMARPASRQKETAGERIRRLRTTKGLTQVELAAQIGTSQPTVVEYEREGVIPGPMILFKLARILGVSPEHILGLENARRRQEVDSPKNLRLWRKLRQVETLSPSERRQVLQLIEMLVERKTFSRGKQS